MRTLLLSILLHCSTICVAVNLNGQLQTALNNMMDGEIQLAVNQIKKAAATNDLIAQFYLAQCYENGIGMPVDKSQAFSMYRRAAERGLCEAMQDLSRCYSNGIGVESSYEKANIWHQRYLQKATGDAIPSLISCLNEGLSKSNNPSEQITKTETITIKNHTPVQQAPNPIVNNVKPSLSNTVANNSIQEQKEVIKSDIDLNIPVSRISNESVFAFIFANEEYHDVAPVPNALNDGESVANYCNITLGIPSTNIHLIKNATLNNIRRELNLMRQIASAYKNDASFIIYYAGHGIPDDDSRDAYLFPVDGFPGDLSTCFSLKELYETIGKLNVKRNLIIFDACFSGSNRNNDMLTSTRGVVIAPKENKPSGNTIVLASSQGHETSYSYEDKQHGLFTYFLLKKIKESKGDVTLGNLFEFVSENVSKKSIVINGKSQTPTVSISADIEEDWKSWTLK